MSFVLETVVTALVLVLGGNEPRSNHFQVLAYVRARPAHYERFASLVMCGRYASLVTQLLLLLLPGDPDVGRSVEQWSVALTETNDPLVSHHGSSPLSRSLRVVHAAEEICNIRLHGKPRLYHMHTYGCGKLSLSNHYTCTTKIKPLERAICG